MVTAVLVIVFSRLEGHFRVSSSNILSRFYYNQHVRHVVARFVEVGNHPCSRQEVAGVEDFDRRCELGQVFSEEVQRGLSELLSFGTAEDMRNSSNLVEFVDDPQQC